MARTIMNWFCLILALSFTKCGIAFASNERSIELPPRSYSNVVRVQSSSICFPKHGGSMAMRSTNGTEHPGVTTSTSLYASTGSSMSLEEIKDVPLRVLFLSADTGGGHRASAEALAKQFLLLYPGSQYELADVWTDHGVLPYRTLVKTYQHMSAHPRQWRLFFHLSNTKLNKVFADFHSHRMSGKKIQKRIEEFNPDVVVSVHPTMNRSPQIAARQISKKQGRHIPFVTVVTDLGSAHSMWFQPDVDKLYVASERLQKMAKKQGGTPDANIVLTGLPIRQDFADQKEKLGDRTTAAGKEHQREIRKELGVDTERQMVLVMGGGEGVGSLSSIVDELYTKLTLQGVDASIYVVCGRNEKLKGQLATRDWDAVVDASKNKKPKKRFGLFRRRRSQKIEEAMKQAEEHMIDPHPQGKVTVVGLGFVTNIAEYMASADVLVTKAGPGTIAEAAAVGLPLMLTSFLPGQEAGNVDVVLEQEFGDFCQDPAGIATEVGIWLKDTNLLDTMSRNAQKAGNPYAAREIVEDIGELTQTWMRLNSVPPGQ